MNPSRLPPLSDKLPIKSTSPASLVKTLAHLSCKDSALLERKLDLDYQPPPQWKETPEGLKAAEQWNETEERKRSAN